MVGKYGHAYGYLGATHKAWCWFKNSIFGMYVHEVSAQIEIVYIGTYST